MFKKFGPWQDHVPRGVSSMYFHGMIYRFEGNYPDGTDVQIKQFLLTTSGQDIVYTIPITLPEIIRQVKQYNMMLIVNLNEVIREDLLKPPCEKFGRVAGIIAGILIENGFNENTCAITLFNEPAERWHLTEMQYAQYCQYANRYVKERLPLIIINDEFHRFNEKIILEQTANIKKKIWGAHHLSSLGSPPKWKNIIDAKTIANEFKVPIFCNEGGSWFKKYQSIEGHNINIKLLEECAKYDYLGCAICLPDINDQGQKTFKNLGYRVWSNNYTTLKSKINWDKFENELKKYTKEEQPMPEYNVPDELKAIADELGNEVGKYEHELPVLTGTGIWQNAVGHKKGQYLTKGDFDATVEKILKLSGIDISVYYNSDGSWNPGWENIAKSNPKPL